MFYKTLRVNLTISGLPVFLWNNFALNNVKQYQMNTVKIEVNGLDINALADKIDNLTNVLTGRATETTATAPEEKLLSRTETAKMLGVTLPTIIDWGKKGILKCYRIGNRVRYKQSEVMETLNNSKAH